MKVEVIDKIIELSPATRTQINGFEYSDKKLHLIESPVVQNAFRVFTLRSIIDYLKSGIDKSVTPETVFINVEGYKSVKVMSKLTETLGRSSLIFAELILRDFFNQYHDPETFNIALQTMFIDDLDRNKVLGIAQNITDEILQTNKDTGIAQSVTIKSGIQHLDKVELPNPVSLRAMRTFPEISPAVVLYILRAKKSSSGIALGLFEFDPSGFQWNMVSEIKGFLKNNLPEELI